MQARHGTEKNQFAAKNAFKALLLIGAGWLAGPGVALAEEGSKSFVDDFSTFERSRWYVSDGWSNGNHQNCTWSSNQVKVADNKLTLSFEKRPYKDREYSCSEIQTTQRFGYGIYEARFKTDTGSGLNAAFFTYIGPQSGQPHDEIDFEALTKDTSKIEVNTYVDGKPHHGSKIDVAGGTDGKFNDYAIVWEPEQIRWYVNGQLVHTASGPTLPSHPQKIFFSFWGTDTLNDWMGAFTDPGRRVVFEIDQISFTELGEECQFPESVACNLQ
ncbi:family 16 glycosylhydrolase [Aquamicrobium sp. LC103]|uniref:endo-1,3-1,4-beta-glycanase ExoK n=1 Tax=Aquamicrobium sp. LC103 TaxID=1120658 RepID=UPI00063E89E8|nr:family 16 glycosylhydrolase [Aquamicrobium sp. LC103]TKT69325.1 glycosyl hydrolase family protein [Aquamicrobium sp. LC103]